MKKSNFLKSFSIILSVLVVTAFVSCSGGLNMAIVEGGGNSPSSSTTLSAPDNVTATTGYSSNTISWSKVSKAKNYNVYRGTSSYSSSALLIATTSSTTYSDSTASLYSSYYYWVTAVDSKGNESEKSSSAYCESYYTALSAPTGLSGTAYSSYNYISWYSVSGATEYRVYYSTTNSISSASYYDTSNTYYYDYSHTYYKTYYWVKAYNGSEYSDASDPISVEGYYYSSGSSSLSTPTNFTATAYSSYNSLSWSSVTGATGYRIYRSTTSTCPSTYFTTTTSTYWYDYSPSYNYYYWISAYNSTSESSKTTYKYVVKSGSGSNTYGGFSQLPTSGTNKIVTDLDTFYDGGYYSFTYSEVITANLASGYTHYYYWYATAGTTYKIHWYDSYEGSDTVKGLKGQSASIADIYVSCFPAGAESSTTYSIFTDTDSGANTPKSFTPTYSGYYVVKVRPYTSSSTGYYAIGVYK